MQGVKQKPQIQCANRWTVFEVPKISQLKFFVLWGVTENTGTLFLSPLNHVFKMTPKTAKERFILKAEIEEKEFKLPDFSLAASIHLSIPFLCYPLYLNWLLHYHLIDFGIILIDENLIHKGLFLWINNFMQFTTILLDYRSSPICLYCFAHQLHLWYKLVLLMYSKVHSGGDCRYVCVHACVCTHAVSHVCVLLSCILN